MYVSASTDGHIYQTIVSKALIYVQKNKENETKKTICGLLGADNITNTWKIPVTRFLEAPPRPVLMHIKPMKMKH